MVNHTMFALFIGVLVLQMYTANPIDAKEKNVVTKLFSSDQLLLAKKAGITDPDLIEGVSYDLTLEEMIKLHPLKNDSNPEFGLALATKVCTVLVPEHETAKNFSSVQEMHLANIVQLSLRFPNIDKTPFIRTCLCPYLSEPLTHEMNANSFGLQFVPYMLFRFIQLKKQDTSGTESVQVARELCNIYKYQQQSKNLENSFQNYVTDLSPVSELSDEEMKKFEEHWNKFKAANPSNSSKSLFENVCNFIEVSIENTVL